MAKIAKKLNSANPFSPFIVGFWIDGEIVCLRCLTEEEKKQPITGEDIIYRKDAEDPSVNACDRCARPLFRDSSEGVSIKLNSANPFSPFIVGFWIDGEIVCLRCLTEEEKKQPITGEDIIYRKDAEDPSINACDRCARPLSRDSSEGVSI